MTIIEVQGWACCATLDSIWYHPTLSNKKFKVDELGDFDNDLTPDNLISALKAQGFKRVNTQVATYGGNY